MTSRRSQGTPPGRIDEVAFRIPLSPDTADLIRRAAARHSLRFVVAAVLVLAGSGLVTFSAVLAHDPPGMQR